MAHVDRRFWPFTPRFSLVAVSVVLVGLLLATAMLRWFLNWPSDQSETVVLIGILVLSLLPVALAILDIVVERGGAIEYGGAKIDFSRSKEQGLAGITVPPNIGVRGEPVSDSSTINILGALRQATAAELIVIDLEDGQAWWETRLFVLISGAVRLGRPDKVVFIGRDENIEQKFLGWAYAKDLMPRILGAHPQYARSLESALAAAQQWRMVEPLDAATAIAAKVLPPPAPTWLQGRLATTARDQSMAFDSATGLHNDLLAEQLLQSDLGNKIERGEGPRRITPPALDGLFRSVLNKKRIDLTWTPKRQLEAFLAVDTAFLAITTNDKYSALLSHAALSNQVFRALLNPGTEARDARDAAQ